MLDLIKKTIEPPYKPRDLYSIFVALFIMLLIPLTVFQATSVKDDRIAAAPLTTQVNQDINVKITSPLNNAFVKDLVTVSVVASDANDTISSVSLYSGKNLLAIVRNPASTNTFTTKVTFDTTKEKNGQQTLVAFAYNSIGEQNQSDNILINLNTVDRTPPSLSFINLRDGDYISGRSFLAKLAASDNNVLTTVSIYLDDTLLKQFAKLPYDILINLNNIDPGNHTLGAKARDFSGNETKTTVEFYKGVRNITN